MKKHNNRKPRPQQFNKRQRRLMPAVATMLAFAAPYAAHGQAVPTPPMLLNSDTNITGSHSGNGTMGGYMAMSGNISFSNGTLSNFIARGGDGAGGGAGMGGALFVNSGATVTLNSVNFVSNIAQGGTGGIVGATAGGTLNGLILGAAGSAGQSGTTPVNDPLLLGDGNGNGLPGFDGQRAGNGIAGGATTGTAGGTGGGGGGGQYGWGQNGPLIATVALDSSNLASAIIQFAGDSQLSGEDCGNPFTTASCPGQVTRNIATVLNLVNVTTQLAVDGATLAQWNAANNRGDNGMGGAGGSGGAGGNGGMAAGGGGGGNGGDGGSAGDGSGAHGGYGGNGGMGGVGGFGAGGGAGGAGGAAGSGNRSATGAAQPGAGGAGGAGGFGGGVGSTGAGYGGPQDSSGNDIAFGGGGGAGLGGAIFVRSGGTLVMHGDSLFVGNNALAGGSVNNGAAGDNAGADLFIMQGATVIFDPGTGHTIEFRGGSNALAISDNTKPKDYGPATNAVGNGGSFEVRSGLVIIGATATISGNTVITGGVLRADDGTGLAPYSNLQFAGGTFTAANGTAGGAGGVLETSGDFIRSTGTTPGFVQWTGSGGFSALGGDLNVKLNGGAELTIGHAGFLPAGSNLLFGSTFADSSVHWANGINNAGSDLNILNTANAANPGNMLLANVDQVTMDGVIRGSGALNINDATHSGQVNLTAANTYTGATNVNGGTLLLTGDGSIAASSQVNVAAGATFDVSGTNSDVALISLAGAGSVALGATNLTLTQAAGTFGGVLSGTGGLTIAAGTETFTGTNTYTGATDVQAGASLLLTGTGSIATSSSVNVDGTFDISGTSAGASITTLSGAGSVLLGAQRLTLTAAADTFDGVISGSGGLTVAAGTETLTGTNTFTGQTIVNSGATLALSGTGSVAQSVGVTANGTFDISATTAGASITTLDGSGSVVLGAQRLTLTAASQTFSGVISDGSAGTGGGITVAAGTETLTGTNTFTGRTIINGGATLALAGTGSVATSSGVTANGTFDISATTAGASIMTLDGSGTVTLGSQRLTLTAASETFTGAIGGAGGITVAGGTETLTGTNGYTGQTIVNSGAQLNLAGTGSIAQSAGVTANGTFDISATTPGVVYIKTLDGNGSVVLGAQVLALSAASQTFGGVISDGSAGTGGGFAVVAGTETLTGTNTYTGVTAVNAGARLNLTGTGSVATSAAVATDGLFDISGTTAGASIMTLAGHGTVALGAEQLTITAGSTTFNGVIGGSGGGVTVAAGIEGLTGTNTYTGRTIINGGAELDLIGTGSIATSSGVTANGTLDIGGTTAGASIKTLDGSGSVLLGSQRLTLTAAAETFTGVISDAGGGGVTVAAGTETLTGTNTFTGSAIINSGAQLNLTGTGSIATASKVTADGTFDISGTTAGASIQSLDGAGTTTLGSQTLTFTNASTTFAGGIQGSGGITVSGGNQGLSGGNSFTGATTIASGATLSLIGTGSIAASSGVTDHGTFDISATTAGASIRNLAGDGTVALGNQNLTISNASGSFDGTIGGAGGSLSITSGSYTLNGANTYSGGTLVQNATLSVSNNGNLGDPAGALTLNNGTLTNLSSTLNLARNLVLAGQGTLNTALATINASGNISGPGLLVADGGGRLNLTGNNSGLTGGIKVINHTTLGANSDAALGAPNAPLVIDSGKLVATGSFNTTRPITVGVNGTIDSGGNSLGLNTPIMLVTPTSSTPLTLALTGSAAITGPWQIDVSGLHVASSSDLHGVGVVGVPTFITGSLSPGNSPGTMVFTAPVTLASSATLNIDIDGTGTGTGAGNYDRVVVMGTANSFTAAGDLVPRLRGITGSATNTYVPPVGTAFQIVVAQGGVFGSFNPMTQPSSGLLPGSRLDALYQTESITLYATPATYTNLTPFNVGLTSNQTSTAGSLDALRPVPGVRTNADATYALGRIFTQTPQALPGVLDHLAGTAYGDALMAGVERSRLFGGAISDQMEARRGGALGAKSEVVRGDNYSAWLTGLGQTYRVGAGSATAFHSGGGGVAVGADMRVKEDGLFGVAAGFTSGNVSSPATGGTVGLDTMHLVAYGSWAFGSDYFVDGQLGTARGDYMARRNLGVVGLTAKGKGDGWGVNGGATAGARYDVAGIRLQPEFGLRFDEMGRNGLTETAGGAVSLAVRSDTATSARAILGVRMQTSFDLGNGYGLAPNARLHYAHELADETTKTTAAFTGAPSVAMVNTSAKSGRDAGIVGIGATLNMPFGVAAYANYAAEMRRNVTGQAFTGGLRFAW